MCLWSALEEVGPVAYQGGRCSMIAAVDHVDVTPTAHPRCSRHDIDHGADFGPQRPRARPSSTRRSYSIRIPEIALAITNCWISDVPSKIVWIKAAILL